MRRWKESICFDWRPWRGCRLWLKGEGKTSLESDCIWDAWQTPRHGTDLLALWHANRSCGGKTAQTEMRQRIGTDLRLRLNLHGNSRGNYLLFLLACQGLLHSPVLSRIMSRRVITHYVSHCQQGNVLPTLRAVPPEISRCYYKCLCSALNGSEQQDVPVPPAAFICSSRSFRLASRARSLGCANWLHFAAEVSKANIY